MWLCWPDVSTCSCFDLVSFSFSGGQLLKWSHWWKLHLSFWKLQLNRKYGDLCIFLKWFICFLDMSVDSCSIILNHLSSCNCFNKIELLSWVSVLSTHFSVLWLGVLPVVIRNRFFWLEGSMSYDERISTVYILCFLFHWLRLGPDSLYCSLFAPHCVHRNAVSYQIN